MMSLARKGLVSPVRADPFSGHCGIPMCVNLKDVPVDLEMDGIVPEEAAAVTVNGKYAGGVIGKPLRLDVTGFLKTGANRILIEPFAPKTARLVIYDKYTYCNAVNIIHDSVNPAHVHFRTESCSFWQKF
jgi:hypothetical protein